MWGSLDDTKSLVPGDLVAEVVFQIVVIIPGSFESLGALQIRRSAFVQRRIMEMVVLAANQKQHFLPGNETVPGPNGILDNL